MKKPKQYPHLEKRSYIESMMLVAMLCLLIVTAGIVVLWLLWDKGII